MPRRPHVLLISYLFPPMGGIGVQRALSVSRYLPDAGFNLHVLRAPNAAGPVMDPDLLKMVPPDVSVHGAYTPEIPFSLRQNIWRVLNHKQKASPSVTTTGDEAGHIGSLLSQAIRKILAPEPEILWTPFALRAARRIIKRYAIDAIIVTAPPFSAFIVGNALKREFPGLKFIADFRDEWLEFYVSNNAFQNNPYARKRAVEIERETVKLADAVVAVTDMSLATIRRRYPEQSDTKFKCITNGYDPTTFATFKPRENAGHKMIVTHMGTAYLNASPRYYAEALNSLEKQARDHIVTRFIGRVEDKERFFLDAVNSEVQCLGFMPQHKALTYLEDTDYLLLTMTDRISMPGKAYEYLATGKPILAIAAPDSEVAKFIEQTGAGYCCDPANIGDVREMILRALENKRRGIAPPKPSDAVIKQYARPATVKQLALLLHDMM